MFAALTLFDFGPALLHPAFRVSPSQVKLCGLPIFCCVGVTDPLGLNPFHEQRPCFCKKAFQQGARPEFPRILTCRHIKLNQALSHLRSNGVSFSQCAAS